MNISAKTKMPSWLLLIALCLLALPGIGLAQGTVVGWGNNSSGQTTVPAELGDVTAIDAGADYSMALRSNGTVVAWGSNFSGETDVPAGLDGVTAIAGGYLHSLALKSDGTVVAWGDPANGATVPPGLSALPP